MKFLAKTWTRLEVLDLSPVIIDVPNPSELCATIINGCRNIKVLRLPRLSNEIRLSKLTCLAMLIDTEFRHPLEQLVIDSHLYLDIPRLGSEDWEMISARLHGALPQLQAFDDDNFLSWYNEEASGPITIAIKAINLHLMPRVEPDLSSKVIRGIRNKAFR